MRLLAEDSFCDEALLPDRRLVCVFAGGSYAMRFCLRRYRSQKRHTSTRQIQGWAALQKAWELTVRL